MTKALDALEGRCLECGSGPVIIDTTGNDIPSFWAYCDQCNHTCCNGVDPEEVVAKWDKLQYQVHSSLFHKIQARIDASMIKARSTENDITFDLKVTVNSPEMYDRVINLFKTMQYLGDVGHSCECSISIDGDGADRVMFEGLPELPEDKVRCMCDCKEF